MNKVWYTIEEICEYSRLSESTIYRYIKKGQLKSGKKGKRLFRLEWIDEFLENSEYETPKSHTDTHVITNASKLKGEIKKRYDKANRKQFIDRICPHCHALGQIVPNDDEEIADFSGLCNCHETPIYDNREDAMKAWKAYVYKEWFILKYSEEDWKIHKYTLI